jgi:hypothetical protein
MNRTDGALIRLVTNFGKTEDINVVDQRLQAFMKELMPVVPAYLPGKSATEQNS